MKSKNIKSIKNKSINNNSHLLQNEFENLVYKNNKIYKINSINNFESFLLKAKILKKYYNKNCEFVWSFCKYFWESHVKMPIIDLAELEQFIEKIK